ncbi:MAG: SpoIIE family protein phosphatase [Holophaga sp.]|nr:SpoIIE family protein phosphatase [Holophaga sp.]
MKTLMLNIPGSAPIALVGEGQSWTIGRSTQNDVPITEASLSRHHARISMREGVLYLEDLGSRNGTCLNGKPIAGPSPLQEDDEIQVGPVTLKLGSLSRGPQVRIDVVGDASTHGSMVIPLERRSPAPAVQETQETLHLKKVIRELQTLFLELLEDSPPEELFAHLLHSLWTLLTPWRAAVMILDAQGNLSTAASRGPDGNRPILLARSLVDAAIKRKESLLYNDHWDNSELGSESLMRSGITSAIVTPIEHEGVVKGLLYLDSRPPQPPFDEEGLRLASTLAHLAVAKLEQARLREETQARKKVDHELNLARHIQQGLLPGFPPEIEGYEVHGNNLPSRQVSGDLFGWWARSDGRWLFCLADVSGKGLGPGLLMASLQATLEAWTERHLSVSELACQLSKALYRHTDGKRFVTAFLTLLDIATGTLTYTNAGHNPALHLRGDGSVTCLEAQGLPLAMFGDNTYGESLLQLEGGDLVMMYTDGITETTDPDGNEFGLEALTHFFVTHRSEPLLAMDSKLFGDLDRFSQGAPYLDDRTLLILRRM